MHILVTGGAGFIGSHLCERLIADGHTVTAVDNFSTGRASNLHSLKDAGEFTLIEGSILNTSLLHPQSGLRFSSCCCCWSIQYCQ
jgi:UDP-glucose 4-epimerase